MRVKLKRPAREPGKHLHHVYFGRANRSISEKYNCVIYLSPEEHNMSNKGVHFNRDFDLMLKREYQRKLETAGWTREEFIETFGRNYID